MYNQVVEKIVSQGNPSVDVSCTICGVIFSSTYADRSTIAAATVKGLTHEDCPEGHLVKLKVVKETQWGLPKS